MMSNNITISILSAGSQSYSKSILVAANNERYLINCGEGTQKLFIENGMKLGSLKNVFFTSKSQQNMCGLIGIALGINYNNNIELCLHGNEKSIDLIKASKKFSDEKTCKIKYHSDSVFNDKTFIIESFNYYGSQSLEDDKCVGYLFSTRKMRPNIDVKKCEAFGVPKNVLKSKKMAEFLHNTHVTLEDGRIIESKSVLNDPQPAEKFLIIECQTIYHIPSLRNAVPLDKLIDIDGHLAFIFHLTDISVFNHKLYQPFIQQINSHFQLHQRPLPKHVVIDSEIQFPLSYSTYYLQTCLNYFFDDKIFPKLKLYEDYITHNNNNGDPEVIKEGLVMVAEPFMEFYLNHNYELNNHSSEMWSRLKGLSEKDIIEQVLYKNEYFDSNCMIEKMNQLKRELIIKKESLHDNDLCKYPNITFIGTSSSTPSKYRNISSILIETNSDDFVLFDCGEGTLDRILLLHGLERGREIICNIRVICVTHHHLDHHSGLYMILRFRELAGNCKPCLILAALNVQMFTMEMDSIFDTKHCQFNCDWYRIDLLQIDNNKFAIDDYPRTVISSFEKELNIQINPVRVFHTSTSYGFVLCGITNDSEKKWKITYSGDRSPKFAGLVTEGMNSDILIHEATMDDGLEEMAAKKYHSTVSQAIEEGIKMNAKFTMLTHFSSRHPLVPPVENKYQNVAQAFDFMNITPGTCYYLKVLDSYLEYLFPKHWHSLVTERQKRLADGVIVKSIKEKKPKLA